MNKHITPIFKVYVKRGESMYMVIQLCNGGDLEGLLERRRMLPDFCIRRKRILPELEVIKIMKAQVEGNAFLNAHGILSQSVIPIENVST